MHATLICLSDFEKPKHKPECLFDVFKALLATVKAVCFL